MSGANEAFSRVRMDAQLKDRGWDVLYTNGVRCEERCRSVLGVVVQQSEALKKAEAVFQSLLARTFNSNHVAEDAKEEAALA